MVNTVYGKNNIDPWPLDYVLSALQFLSLNNNKKSECLPEPFTETLFHGNEGDFFSSDPLLALFSIYSDCIKAGMSWDDWIDDKSLKNLGLEQLFTKLYDKCIQACYLLEDNNMRYKQEGFSKELSKNFNECAHYAKKMLIKLDLYCEEDIFPISDCKKLLDEYSYKKQFF